MHKVIVVVEYRDSAHKNRENTSKLVASVDCWLSLSLSLLWLSIIEFVSLPSQAMDGMDWPLKESFR